MALLFAQAETGAAFRVAGNVFLEGPDERGVLAVAQRLGIEAEINIGTHVGDPPRGLAHVRELAQKHETGSF
jgi:hypothetical protein